MDEVIKTYLHDILNSINEIESYFEGKPRIFSDFCKDIKTKRAVQRNLEIIGEAINRIIKFSPEFSIHNSRQIIDLRNRIIHSYDNISDEIIYGIMINQIPELKKEIDSYLK